LAIGDAREDDAEKGGSQRVCKVEIMKKRGHVKGQKQRGKVGLEGERRERRDSES